MGDPKPGDPHPPPLTVAERAAAGTVPFLRGCVLHELGSSWGGRQAEGNGQRGVVPLASADVVRWVA